MIYLMKNWFLYDGSLVCVPAKNGGTAFYRAAFEIGDDIPDCHVYSVACTVAETEYRGPYSTFSASQLIHHPDRDGAFIAVRDPVSRFLSLWRSKCLRKDPNLWFMHGWSMKKLMDVIEAGPFTNAHWIPQWAYLIPGAIPIHYEYLQERLGLSNRRCNETKHGVESAELVRERIERHYAQDFDLWQRAEK